MGGTAGKTGPAVALAPVDSHVAGHGGCGGSSPSSSRSSIMVQGQVASACVLVGVVRKYGAKAPYTYSWSTVYIRSLLQQETGWATCQQQSQSIRSDCRRWQWMVLGNPQWSHKLHSLQLLVLLAVFVETPPPLSHRWKNHLS